MFITSKGSTIVSQFSMDVLCRRSFLSYKSFWREERMGHYCLMGTVWGEEKNAGTVGGSGSTTM